MGEYDRCYDACVQARAILHELGDELFEAYGARADPYWALATGAPAAQYGPVDS
jgi:hypothetical protein